MRYAACPPSYLGTCYVESLVPGLWRDRFECISLSLRWLPSLMPGDSLVSKEVLNLYYLLRFDALPSARNSA